jgi:hypothetical protein
MAVDLNHPHGTMEWWNNGMLISKKFSNLLVTFKRWAKNYIEKITVSL